MLATLLIGCNGNNPTTPLPIKGKVTVLEPKEGSNWRMNDALSIAWSSENVQTVDIFIRRMDIASSPMMLVKNMPAQAATIQIPLNGIGLDAGNYVIRISGDPNLSTGYYSATGISGVFTLTE